MPDALDLFTTAWRDQRGYVCISVRNPALAKEESGYWQDRIFTWPKGRVKVEEFLKKARKAERDVYWSPAVYSSPHRASEGVLGHLQALWADLDEVNPASLPSHLKPTAAWQSSPDRYQALWLLDKPLKPHEQSELNQRLTYAIGADKGGWDLTQVLRTPGTKNHKYDDEPEVKLLYLNGHVLNARRLAEDLPEVVKHSADVTSLQDPKDVLAKYRKRLSTRAKQLIRARHARTGERSDRLWELECLLAEVGMDETEIVSVTKWTVWNKFEGRKDELSRLFAEAVKAIDHVAPQDDEDLPDALADDEDVGPITWQEFDSEHKPISWVVQDVWGESEVGFISGLPKSYKSWISLDLAVSIASGTPFLGQFDAKRANVLLVQEEDPRVVLQDRLVKVAANKGLIEVETNADGTFSMKYDLPDNLFIISNQGFTLTEEWLELLEQWILERQIEFLVLDPLMMIAAAGFDEFKAFEFMQQVLKPLKRLRARTRVAIALVHHHIKSSSQASARDMYGSVALWAWEEAALHLNVTGIGKVSAERFSKHSLLPPLSIEIGDVADHWHPEVQTGTGGGDVWEVLVTMEAGATVDELSTFMGIGRETIGRKLRVLLKQEKVEKVEGQSTGGRPSYIWRAVV